MNCHFQSLFRLAAAAPSSSYIACLMECHDRTSFSAPTSTCYSQSKVGAIFKLFSDSDLEIYRSRQHHLSKVLHNTEVSRFSMLANNWVIWNLMQNGKKFCVTKHSAIDLARSLKARAWIDGAESALRSNMLEFLLDLLWSKMLSAPSIYVRVLKDFALSIPINCHFCHARS